MTNPQSLRFDTQSSNTQSSNTQSSSPSSAILAGVSFDTFAAVVELSDEILLNQLSWLVKQDRELTIGLLLHLGEIDVRKLHCAKGYSSLFGYCTSRLGFSEDVAYKRIGAARLVRRFPLALELLGRGEMNLTTLMLVGPHLTDQNHVEWLSTTARKTKREVEYIVATRSPKADVSTSVRKLPERKALKQRETNLEIPKGQPAHESDLVAGGREPRVDEVEPGEPADLEAQAINVTPAGPIDTAVIAERRRNGSATTGPIPPDLTPRSVARIEPLSANRYRVTFTVSEDLKSKLERARELASHIVSPGDLPALIERAIDRLIQHEEKRRFSASTRRRVQGGAARGAQELDPDPAELGEHVSRYLPASLRRAIWQRDAGQCSFVDGDGNRCSERRFLEIEHKQPHARGGLTSLDNCCLLCRAHNIYRAERAFGKEFMAKRIAHQTRCRDAGTRAD